MKIIKTIYNFTKCSVVYSVKPVCTDVYEDFIV